MRLPRFRFRTSTRRRRFVEFHRDEDGSVSVEFVLWIPLFLALIAVITDLSFVYVVNANMYDVARDTVRRWAKDDGEFPGADLAAVYAAVEAHVKDELDIGYDADGVTSWEVDPDWNIGTGEATVAIRADSADVDIFGIMQVFGVNDLVAVVTMRIEP